MFHKLSSELSWSPTCAEKRGTVRWTQKLSPLVNEGTDLPFWNMVWEAKNGRSHRRPWRRSNQLTSESKISHVTRTLDIWAPALKSTKKVVTSSFPILTSCLFSTFCKLTLDPFLEVILWHDREVTFFQANLFSFWDLWPRRLISSQRFGVLYPLGSRINVILPKKPLESQ